MQTDTIERTSPSPPPTSTPGIRVSFGEEGPLELSPGQSITLSVGTSPPKIYEIHFALLGEPLDASLDKATALTDASGQVDITLKAPNTSTSFKILASADGAASDEIAVNIKEQGLGQVRVIPAYAGTRHVDEWTASAHAGTNCKALAGLLPDKIAPTVSAASPGDSAPVLEDVPVGPNIAVVLHSAHAMWGCTDEAHLKAGQLIETVVTVVDQPLNLAATDLDVSIAFPPADEAYLTIMKNTSDALLDAFMPAAPMDVPKALLDAMEAALPPDQLDAFQQERALSGWDQKTEMHLGALPVLPRDQVQAWLAEALDPSLNPQAPPAAIDGHLMPAASVAGKAWFSPLTISGLPIDQAGMPATHLINWSAQTGDTVLLSGTFYWIPSRLAGNLAFARARETFNNASSMGEILSSVLDCPLLSATLGGTAGCDALCMESACAQALSDLWLKALELSNTNGQPGFLQMVASGHATVDGFAAPNFFEGKWLGVLSNGAIETNASGILSGKAPEMQPPAP